MPQRLPRPVLFPKIPTLEHILGSVQTRRLQRFQLSVERRPVATPELIAFPALSSEMSDEVCKVLSGGPSQEILVNGFNMTLSRSDLQTLSDNTWLNDEVINFYFSLIKDRSEKCPPSIYFLNSFFYQRLLQVGHRGLKNWTCKVDLFNFDKIMIPIHLGMHWCLAVIDVQAKTISYYDSLLGDNLQCIAALRDYIAAEYQAKKNSPLDIQNWKLIIEKDIPKQLNNCDCGVFICKYADYISQNKAFDFDQSCMPYFRRHMIWQIVQKSL
jgi:sentrin-specific protease 1